MDTPTAECPSATLNEVAFSRLGNQGPRHDHPDARPISLWVVPGVLVLQFAVGLVIHD